jgi:hypothetical protein
MASARLSAILRASEDLSPGAPPCLKLDASGPRFDRGIQIARQQLDPAHLRRRRIGRAVFEKNRTAFGEVRLCAISLCAAGRRGVPVYGRRFRLRHLRCRRSGGRKIGGISAEREGHGVCRRRIVRCRGLRGAAVMPRFCGGRRACIRRRCLVGRCRRRVRRHGPVTMPAMPRGRVQMDSGIGLTRLEERARDGRRIHRDILAGVHLRCERGG